jgi:hypothetical protein
VDGIVLAKDAIHFLAERNADSEPITAATRG